VATAGGLGGPPTVDELHVKNVVLALVAAVARGQRDVAAALLPPAAALLGLAATEFRELRKLLLASAGGGSGVATAPGFNAALRVARAFEPSPRSGVAGAAGATADQSTPGRAAATAAGSSSGRRNWPV
jgi:hypothetical protein